METAVAAEGCTLPAARRDWLAAAEAFGDVGWMYDPMPSLLDDEAAWAEALDIARRLGAEPLTKRLTASPRRGRRRAACGGGSVPGR
jgi:hypothetical protein